jgi:class 3 adenylate cyclase
VVEYPLRSLEDFLTSTTLTVDAQLDDGWGATFPVKGREIEAAVLFADITAFTARTLELTSAETLIYVNNFFAWVSAEALRGRNAIIDKYIGDALMVVFSTEFGSPDPFVEAVQAARFMAEHDVHAFTPHVGLASGSVIVGYVGTPLKYNCSVFGAPVALAARCAAVQPEPSDESPVSSTIVFPASAWGSRDFDAVFPPRRYRNPDGSTLDQPHSWELRPERTVDLKNVGPTAIREVVNHGFHFPSQTAEDRAREGLAAIKAHGRYWPPKRSG